MSQSSCVRAETYANPTLVSGAGEYKGKSFILCRSKPIRYVNEGQMGVEYSRRCRGSDKLKFLHSYDYPLNQCGVRGINNADWSGGAHGHNMM
eukprot:COSAG01_NODE_35025_length_538_cov_1.154897_1_plen_92_part_10